jgi:hypothetical protein
MNKTKMIGFPFAAAMAAAFLVFFISMCIFGFRLSGWDEWQGGIVGLVGTGAAVAAAILGLKLTRRAPGPEAK